MFAVSCHPRELVLRLRAVKDGHAVLEETADTFSAVRGVLVGWCWQGNLREERTRVCVGIPYHHH